MQWISLTAAATWNLSESALQGLGFDFVDNVRVSV